MKAHWWGTWLEEGELLVNEVKNQEWEDHGLENRIWGGKKSQNDKNWDMISN